MRPNFFLLMVLVFYLPVRTIENFITKDHPHDDDDDYQIELEDDENEFENGTDNGMYLGATCEFTCSDKLVHVFCNPTTGLCECEKKYPVKLNPTAGCGKPKKLGEQCYYRETCEFTDKHSSCVQVHHNAICQCEAGFHSVAIKKPSKRVFCAEDHKAVTSDISTLVGVIAGIALLSGLICFVLRLFNQNRFARPHRFGNANLAPPILFSTESGFPISVAIVHHRSASRTSSQRSFVSEQSRRVSSAQVIRGVPISASRTGSRRPSLVSIQSGTSIKSYSTRRYEREREQKEEREMQKRLARMTSAMSNSSSRIPTPSPRSTDELLPTLDEDRQVPLAVQEENEVHSLQGELPSTSRQFP